MRRFGSLRRAGCLLSQSLQHGSAAGDTAAAKSQVACGSIASSIQWKLGARARCVIPLASSGAKRSTSEQCSGMPSSWIDAMDPSQRVAYACKREKRFHSKPNWNSVIDAFSVGSLVMSSIALLRFALGFNGSDKQQRVRLWHIVNGDSLQLFSPITRMHMKQNQQQNSSPSSSFLESAAAKFHSKLNECTSVALNGLGLQQVSSGKDRKALELFCQASQYNYAPAQFNVGLCYERGRGVAKDLKKAAEWYAKAAAQGHAKAQFNLGALCYKGAAGIDRDVKHALKLLEQSADQGLQQAQLFLGLCYFDSKDIPQDLEKAAELLRAAASQKNPVAQFNLALCFEHGYGVKKDETEAAKLYKLAAMNGYSAVQYNLAAFYEKGLGGLVTDVETACLWYKKAAANGNDKARERLAAIQLDLDKRDVSNQAELEPAMPEVRVSCSPALENPDEEQALRHAPFPLPLMVAVVH